MSDNIETGIATLILDTMAKVSSDALIIGLYHFVLLLQNGKSVYHSPESRIDKECLPDDQTEVIALASAVSASFKASKQPNVCWRCLLPTGNRPLGPESNAYISHDEFEECQVIFKSVVVPCLDILKNSALRMALGTPDGGATWLSSVWTAANGKPKYKLLQIHRVLLLCHFMDGSTAYTPYDLYVPLDTPGLRINLEPAPTNRKDSQKYVKAYRTFFQASGLEPDGGPHHLLPSQTSTQSSTVTSSGASTGSGTNSIGLSSGTVSFLGITFAVDAVTDNAASGSITVTVLMNKKPLLRVVLEDISSSTQT